MFPDELGIDAMTGDAIQHAIIGGGINPPKSAKQWFLMSWSIPRA
jgi:hypothetical protein